MPALTLPGTGESSEGKGGSKSTVSPGAAARLPAVDRLLASPHLSAAAAEHGTLQVKRAVQEVLADNRACIVAGAPVPDSHALIEQVRLRLSQACASRLRPVFNLSGTVIHTNLGRALLADEAIDAVGTAMRSYTALEYDVASGGRGDRDHIVEEVLRELTGAEAATVVNNNAAAVLLSLKALAARKEAIISRGELIEIGGAFRMPDIMKAAGCKLVEVGTTNRTHARDYQEACGAKTGLIVKAHWSNYAITGFTATVDDATLAQIAHAHNVPYMVDLGAGAMIDLALHGLPKEPLPQESLAAGADIVTFSGDKLLGGPQAGLIVGRRDAVARIKKDPLKRALRVSKLTLAALEATLRIYASGHRLAERLPTLALLTRRQAEIRAVCERIAGAVKTAIAPAFTATVEDCASQIGSGSMPAERLSSAALVLRPGGKVSGRAIERLQERLRALPTPVIGRIADGALWLDLRCLLPRDEASFVDNLNALDPR
ncbi:MAG TPA: L-seryl-tRNA(Sec) selenium transferase [Burkholderiaceae bacterium]|nr:L-seryl-tRNA(Sec) selenium transferase [Burkholderiaceae bacterium]